MRIGLYGGTFNPIHTGHLLTAQHILDELQLDKILFIPNGLPPHRQLPGISNQIRLDMVLEACKLNPRFEVSTVELDSDQTSYSYQTVAKLKQQFLHDHLFFVAGVDSILNYVWKNFDQLLSNLSGFAVASRPGYDRIALKEKLALEGLSHLDRILHIETPLFEISSTEIRERRQRGASLQYFLPEGLVELIESQGLYLQCDDSLFR
jgi:nicotinate-nucleotide adenylyltransferase